jgi:THO complex subunit 3
MVINPSALEHRNRELTCGLGSGLEIVHTETGEYVYTFKTAGPCEAVAWAPTRYCLAYSDLGILRIIGVDAERK